MSHYWRSRDESIVLFHGDCRDVLASMPNDSVASVICDPPYSEHVHSKSRRGSSLPDVRGGKYRGEKNARANVSRARDLGFDAITDELRALASFEFARLSTKWVLVFSDIEKAHRWREDFVDVGLDYVRTGAWIRVGGTPQFSGDRPASGLDAVVAAHAKGKKAWNKGGKTMIYTVPIVLNRGGPNSEKRIHTTQKPLALMRQLVEDFTSPGDTVLDPFAGSGTTLVACMERGRSAIGIEIDPENAKKAAERLLRAEAQGQLFIPKRKAQQVDIVEQARRT